MIHLFASTKNNSTTATDACLQSTAQAAVKVIGEGAALIVYGKDYRPWWADDKRREDDFGFLGLMPRMSSLHKPHKFIEK